MDAMLSVLTAMITPAVLILACGSLSLTTSQRLNRSISRSRSISANLNEIQNSSKTVSGDEMLMWYGQITKAVKRTVLLQRVMTMLYTAQIFFISTSFLIAIFGILEWTRHWPIIFVPIAGAVSLLAASVLLIMESRVAQKSVDEEMKFILSAETVKKIKENM
jgi:hypothetical protein